MQSPIDATDLHEEYLIACKVQMGAAGLRQGHRRDRWDREVRAVD